MAEFARSAQGAPNGRTYWAVNLAGTTPGDVLDQDENFQAARDLEPEREAEIRASTPKIVNEAATQQIVENARRPGGGLAVARGPFTLAEAQTYYHGAFGKPVSPEAGP